MTRMTNAQDNNSKPERALAARHSARTPSIGATIATCPKGGFRLWTRRQGLPPIGEHDAQHAGLFGEGRQWLGGAEIVGQQRRPAHRRAAAPQ